MSDLNWQRAWQQARASVEDMQGKHIVSIEGMEKGSDEVTFTCHDGEKFRMYHRQDCCENVRIEDVCGDPNDLIHATLFVSYEESNADPHDAGEVEYMDESHTWTFYVFGTEKGRVTLRWLGESNGYYSESVDFERIAWTRPADEADTNPSEAL